MHSRPRRPTAFLRSLRSRAAMKYSRKEVRERLRKTLDAGRPVIAAGAGIGLSAKFAEKGGADLVIIYNSGRYRMTGYSSLCGYLPIGDANAIVKEMGEREVLPVTRDTPVIAGVFAADPTREMAHFLGELIDLGFSGVINFPSIAWIEGELRAGLESSGLGFQREVDMIRIAGEAGLFTLAYVFTPDEAIAMAKAGVDVSSPIWATLLVVPSDNRTQSHSRLQRS